MGSETINMEIRLSFRARAYMLAVSVGPLEERYSQARLFCRSFLRKGEVFAYVGNTKHQKDLRLQFKQEGEMRQLASRLLSELEASR